MQKLYLPMQNFSGAAPEKFCMHNCVNGMGKTVSGRGKTFTWV